MTRIEIMQYAYLSYYSWRRGYIGDEVYFDRLAALGIEWEFATG
jgi:hypothetical protein